GRATYRGLGGTVHFSLFPFAGRARHVGNTRPPSAGHFWQSLSPNSLDSSPFRWIHSWFGHSVSSRNAPHSGHLQPALGLLDVASWRAPTLAAGVLPHGLRGRSAARALGDQERDHFSRVSSPSTQEHHAARRS